ncbi:MAG TPA: hypothetical protein VFW05_08195, partial [Verrucomicrobiae bacterium]|nr:hypothetical protein [Verrucomicrobiae bacterium]
MSVENFLLWHPEWTPALVVRFSGGDVEELMMEDGGVRIETKGEPQTSNNELRTSNAALTPSPSRLTREERDEGSVTLPSIHYQS